MVDYRRNFVAGGTFAFAVTLKDRQSSLLVDEIAALRASFRHVQQSLPFETVAAVVLPDHLHVIWKLPDGDADFPTRWRLIKTHFTKSLAIASPWQRRYWEHTIRDDRDLRNHIDYIHYNPKKHALIERVCDWPHSSFHHFVERGVYARDWAAPPDLIDVYE